MQAGAALFVAIAVLSTAQPAQAEEGADVAPLQACVAAVDPFEANLGGCEGLIYQPCLADPANGTTLAMADCYIRERDAWHFLIEQTEARLLEVADAEQRAEYLANRPVWEEDRSRTCAYYASVIRGTVAQLVMGECVVETAVARLGEIKRVLAYLNVALSGPRP